MTNIEIEYQRWITVMKMKQYFTNLSSNASKKYELLNILERFLINSANYSKNRSPDKIFVKISSGDDFRVKNMKNELTKKRLVENSTIPKIIAFLAQKIADFIDSISDFMPEEHEVEIENESLVKYRTFSKKIARDRINLLLGLSNPREIAGMILRYECLLPRGQHWNIPQDWHKYVCEKYDVSVEAFASPINCQIIGLRDNVRFCSLFADTDSCFGSLGSILKLSAGNVDGKSITMNPPYIIEIMDKTFDIADNLLRRADVRIFVNVPEWRDTYFHSKFMGSKYLVHEVFLRRGTYFHEDSYSPRRRKIKAKFDSRIFVLDSNEERADIDYSDITTGFSE